LPEELLVDANGSVSTTREALRLVGPLAGAGLYSWLGGSTVAMVDAGTFVIAAGAVVAITVSETPVPRRRSHWRTEFLAGIRHLAADRPIRHTLVALGAALLVIGFLESATFALVQAFHRPPSFIGVVISVQGVGAIIGGACSARIVRRLGETATLAWTLLLMAAGIAICAATPWLAVVFVGVVVLGFCIPVLLVAFTTLLQVRTPNRLMGRVSTATDVVLGTPQAGSIAVGALLVTLMGYRTIYAICAAGIFVSGGYLLAVFGTSRPAPVVFPAADGLADQLGEGLAEAEPGGLE
jgi:predicted MFS family arabinose efflux permease